MKQMLDGEEIELSQRSLEVPIDYRLSYKLPQVLIVLAQCSNRKTGCTALRLQTITSALQYQDHVEKLLEYAKEPSKHEIPLIRFDCASNRAIDFAIAEGLMETISSSKYRLTDKGREYVGQINKNKDLLVLEKQNAARLSLYLTESVLRTITKKWREAHAENQ